MDTNIDFTSGAWQQITRWAESELDRARKQNDGELDDLQTASVRGEIKFIKKLLSLPKVSAAMAAYADPAE